jgi:hypothetical protein
MNILSKNGELIQSVEEWKAKAPPKQGDKHWKDDRSAKELARAWFRPSPPAELLTLLHDTFPTDKIILTDAYPECVVRLDDLRGEHRNTDLLVLGVAGIRKLAVSIEAKADEAFGSQCGEYYDQQRAAKGSKLPKRMEALSQGLFGKNLDSHIRSLPYQLLHGTAGAVIAAKARKADVAFFVVHEFISAGLKPEKLKCNDDAWKEFVRVLSQDAGAQIRVGRAVGPIQIPGGERIPVGMPLYLAKIQTQLS